MRGSAGYYTHFYCHIYSGVQPVSGYHLRSAEQDALSLSYTTPRLRRESNSLSSYSNRLAQMSPHTHCVKRQGFRRPCTELCFRRSITLGCVSQTPPSRTFPTPARGDSRF